jgi:hypothetical protein
VRAIGLLLSIFSFAFHAVLSLVMVALAGVSLTSGEALRLEQVPGEGATAAYWLLAGFVIGGLSTLFGALGKARLLFLVWTVVVFLVMVRGYIFSAYTFEGMDHFRISVLIMAGAFVAMLGGFAQWRVGRSHP